MTHGYGASRLMMWPLASRLRQKGYRVVNWGYPSLRKDVAQHAEQFRGLLQDLEADSQTHELFVVAHSMGNILTRAALQGESLAKLRRIVMLCPPNRGSHIASLYAPALGWLSQPLRDISDRPHSFVNRLPLELDGDYEIGIIRATTDFVVHDSSTILPAAKAYTRMTGLHSSILFREETALEVHCFLRTGEFSSKLTR